MASRQRTKNKENWNNWWCSFLLFSTLASAAVVGQQLFDDPEQRGDQTGGNEGDTVQISTPLGPIVGRIVSEAGSEGENKHIQFLGVPYAEAPVAEMRFQDPIPKREWKDAYDALNFKASCLQKDVLGGNPDDLVGDEDCLFINVFTPRVPSQNGRVPNQASLLSVMVWIHGGSWDFGDGRIDPTPIVNQNIIVVSMNYRLGPLGFLNLGTAKIAGNQGLKDQLEALRWVNANILSFGGDPNKVTLFGQSSGAVSAHLHQISPQGAGLYRAIIAQSGSALSHMVEPLNRRVVERESRRYVDKIGCSQGGSVALAEIMTCLFQKNVEDLLFEPMEETESVEVRLELEGEVPNNLIQNTLDGVGPFDSFGPSMDEQSDNPFIPEHPYLAIKAGHQKDLPIILGISSNDGGIKMAQYWDKLNAVNGNWSYYGPKIVLNLPFDRTKRYDRLISNVTRHFYTGKADLSIDESQGIVDMMTDSAFRAPALKASHLQARSQSKPLYYYELSHQPSKSMVEIFGINTGAAREDFGVVLYDDLSYLFNVPYGLVDAVQTQEDLDTRSAIIMMWTNFAKFGDPTPFENPKLPTWKRYQLRGQHYMEIGPNSELKKASHSNSMYFWQKLYWFDLDRAFKNAEAVNPKPPAYRLKPLKIDNRKKNNVRTKAALNDDDDSEDVDLSEAPLYNSPVGGGGGGAPIFESYLPSSETSLFTPAQAAFRPTFSYAFGSAPGAPQYRYFHLK